MQKNDKKIRDLARGGIMEMTPEQQRRAAIFWMAYQGLFDPVLSTDDPAFGDAENAREARVFDMALAVLMKAVREAHEEHSDAGIREKMLGIAGRMQEEGNYDALLESWRELREIARPYLPAREVS